MAEIIHPGMLAGLEKFYPQQATIQSRTDTTNAIGELVPAWADVAGLTGLAARRSPAGGRESKQAHEVYTRATDIVALAGYYPTITTAMQCVISGETLDILLVEHDAQHITTRLVCEVVR